MNKENKFLTLISDSLMLLVVLIGMNILNARGLSSTRTVNKKVKLVKLNNIFLSENFKKGSPVLLSDFKVSFKGDVFFINSKSKRVLKYSKSGKFEKYIGEFGQGEGKYISPTKLFLNKSSLYVYDSSIKKIHKYDIKGRYKKTIIVKKIFNSESDFFVSEDEDIFAIWGEYTSQKILDVVGKMNKNGKIKIIKILREIKNFYNDNCTSNNSYDYFTDNNPPLYNLLAPLYTKLFMKVSKNGFFIFNNRSKEIRFYNGFNGKVERKIILGYRRKKLSLKEKKVIVGLYGKAELKILPKYRPFFENVFIDDCRNLYVVRVSNLFAPERKKIRRIDVYDFEGNFLYDFKLPKKTVPLYFGNGYAFLLRQMNNSFFYISKVLIQYRR